MEINAEETTLALVKAGFLRVRDTVDVGCGADVASEQAFWFAAPHVGVFAASVVNGRDELRSMLRRTKRKEMLRRELDPRRLRHSTLGIGFHITDLVARSEAVEVPTAFGPLVRLRQTGHEP